MQVFVLGVVKLLILSISLKIIRCFLPHSNHKYKYEGRHIGEQKSNFEWRVELTERNQQEKQIVEELELVVEHDWQERENVVSLIPDFVAHKSFRTSHPVQKDSAPFSRNQTATPASDPITDWVFALRLSLLTFEGLYLRK